ncbi:hypothetical protein BDW66DRAFT_160755 [Aspergillus desertorum]
MEGLSSAASVIAVIQLTASLVELCGGYIQQVKHARDESLALQRAITSLQETLQDLHNLMQSNDRKALPTSSRLVSNITDCLSDLQALEKRLDPGKQKRLMSRVGWRALMWPLRRAEVEDVIQKLERYKSSFLLSLQVDPSRHGSGFGLAKLEGAMEAGFESFSDRDEAQCLQGTRTALLQQIMDWAMLPSQKSIFWLKGMAGTGKSTISRTVARLLKNTNHLGASFFFKRGEGDRGNAKKLFPTLTRQLMLKISDLRSGCDELEQQQLLQEFQGIIGVIILLAVPLSINTLSLFLGIEADKISNLPVRIIHLSFRDFLLQSQTRPFSDEQQKHKAKFLVDEQQKHKAIARFCLTTMRRCLRKDICNLASPATRRTDIDDQDICRYLPPELQYSCRYWIYHFKQSQPLPSEIEDVRQFLQKHFLHWVEAMSLLGLISEVVGMLDLFDTNILGVDSSLVAEFLHDAKRFVLKNHQIANEAPLQIYCAGLVFAPRTAIIRTQFKDDLPSWICRLPKVNEKWSAELQTLDGHSARVWSVAFSPDGRLLASGSDGHTVRLWDTATGALQETLSTAGIVNELCFSQDGSCISTNLGSLNIEAGCRNSISFPPETNPEVYLEGDWIALNGRQVLWLPPEARPSCLAVKSNTVALGHSSGRVSFIKFRV